MESPCTDLVIFSHASPFSDVLQLDSRIFTFLGRDIIMNQKWKSGGKGGTAIGFGASIYNSSIVLAHFVESMSNEVWSKVTVELGSGPGLVSVVAMLCGAALALCTDGDDSSLSLAESNLRQNHSQSSSPYHVEKLFWGDSGHISSVQNIIRSHSTSKKSTADFILASDVAALPYEEHYDGLVQTLVSLSDTNTVIFLAYQNRHCSESKFFDLLDEHFVVKRLPRSAIHRDFRHLPIVLFQANLKPPSNQRILDA